MVALTLLVLLDRFYLSRHPGTPALYDAGVRYYRDADRRTQQVPAAELWLTIPDALAAGGADCKVLAAWRVAELLERGEDPAARPELEQHGSLWHVVVRRGDGSREDPSARLGMRGAA